MTKQQEAIVGMLRRHIENIRAIKLYMIFFLFHAIGDTMTLKVESVGYNVEGHQYIYIYRRCCEH
jgi:hypothetical protein